LISLTTEEEDIKDVLRTILRSDRMIAIFKGSVDGTIDLDEEDVPARGIFNRLMTEFGLESRYDDATRTVTIQRRGAVAQAEAAAPPVRDFIVPQYVTFEVIRSVLESFGLGTEGVRYDPNTGTLSLFGKSERISDIRTLVEQLDLSVESRQKRELEQQRADYESKIYEDLLNAKVKVIPLRYANVGSTTKTFQGQSISVPGIEETLQAILGVQIKEAGGRAGAAPVVLGNLGQTGGSGSSSLRFGQAAALHRLNELTRPSISIDRRTNSVIVRGSEKAIAEVEDVINQLDQPLKMIQIEVMIVNASRGVSEQLGIDYRGHRDTENNKKGFGIDTGTTGGQASVASTGVNAITLLPAPPASDLLASFIVTGADSFLQVQLAALSQDNKTQVIASPKVITLDNVGARITRSRNIFVTIPASGDSGQDLEEISTGLSVNILPSIVPSDVAGEEQLIRLSLNATNSAPGSGAFGQIDVTSQEIETEVLIPEGATFVLGGLFDDTRSEQQSGLPGLRELPLIGQLFRTDSSTDALEETIFFITPKIILEDEVLAKDIAARVGTLEYMKRQRSSLERMTRDVSSPKDHFPHALRVLVEDE
jgi:type II secretory pathway component GspD/PulD (secretin)